MRAEKLLPSAAKIVFLIIHQLRLYTPDDSGPFRKTPWIRSYEKQVIDLTELRGSWNVAYIYNKESLRKASQHHHKGLLLGRAICRWIAICYYKVRWFLIKCL